MLVSISPRAVAPVFRSSTRACLCIAPIDGALSSSESTVDPDGHASADAEQEGRRSNQGEDSRPYPIASDTAEMLMAHFTAMLPGWVDSSGHLSVRPRRDVFWIPAEGLELERVWNL